MRNTDQRVKAALQGAEKLKQKQRFRNTVIASGGLSVCLIIALACTLSSTLYSSPGGSTTVGFSASVFSSPQLLSYIIIGILSFILGICVTILCVLLRKKQQEESNHHDH